MDNLTVKIVLPTFEIDAEILIFAVTIIFFQCLFFIHK